MTHEMVREVVEPTELLYEDKAVFNGKTVKFKLIANKNKSKAWNFF